MDWEFQYRSFQYTGVNDNNTLLLLSNALKIRIFASEASGYIYLQHWLTFTHSNKSHLWQENIPSAYRPLKK